MQDGPGNVLGRAQPREHRHPRKLPLAHRGAEQHAGRLVVDLHFDAGLLPLRLKHLLDQFPRSVAGGGLKLQAKPAPRSIVPDAAAKLRPARFFKQLDGGCRVERVFREVIGVVAIQRVDMPVRHRLLAFEQLAGDRVAVDRHQECAPDPHVGQDRVVELQVDMLEE